MPPALNVPLPYRATTSTAHAEQVRARSRICAATTRALDIGIALLILALCTPMLIVVVIAIRLDSPGPLLFRQNRLGYQGRHFWMFKFRTMKWQGVGHDREGMLPPLYGDDERKSKHDPRVTRVGFHLRRWSIDELPNLLNVLRGEMALVGPRPGGCIAQSYGNALPQVVSVKPGVTGLWQIMGRADLAFSQRVALDCEYVRRRSIRMDLWILMRTVGAVLSRRGAY